MAVRRWGAEVQVNAAAAGFQGAADVAALADGGWVVAWVDAADPAGPRIRLQRYDASGAPLGGAVSLAGPSPLSDPSILSLAGGGFVIAAESAWSAEDRDVQATRFDAAGQALGTVAIDGLRGPTSTEPVLCRLGSGFAALHERDGDLFATWYDGAGALLGGEIRVNASSAGIQNLADMAELAQGGFVAAWMDQNLGRVHARVFAADGSPVNPSEVQANTSSLGGNQGNPAVAGLASGGFVVLWETNTSLFPNSAPDIRARLFDAAGTPLGGDFAVNTRTFGPQSLPEVVALRNGGFAAVWVDLSGTPAIRGQIFDAYGMRVGWEFSVNTSPVAADLGPDDLSLAELADGRLVVTWRSPEDDGSHGVVQQVVDPREGVVEGTGAAEALFGNDAWGDEISGFGGADMLWGLRGDDVLLGGEGGDTLRGGRGEDMLHGHRGNDLLLGGTGPDDLFGGSGTDTASYLGSGALVLALDGSLEGTAEAAGDALWGIEIVQGGAWSDRLRGNGLANTLRGGEGADTLEGMDGADSLAGEGGDDRLLGGAGSDLLTGGTGADAFVFAALSDSPPDAGRDRIADFAPGQDRIALALLDADEGVAGDQAFVLDAGGGFVAGEIRQSVTGGSLLIALNTDADSLAEFSVLLLGHTAPLALSDFDP